MIKPYIELNTCIDEYADGSAIGIFIGTWCLVGWLFHAHDGTWLTGPILFNRSIGLWNGD